MDKKSFTKNIPGYIVPAALCIFFIFVWNPFRLAVYSLLTGLLLYLANNIRQRERWALTRQNAASYFTYAGLTYLFLVVAYSLSPYLQWKEFQWTHPHYHQAEGQIQDSTYGVYRQRGNLYAFVDISYSYHIGSWRYEQQQQAALRYYSFPVFSNTTGKYLKDRVHDQFSQLQREKSYVIMVNEQAPDSSRLFAGKQAFYWSGSILKNFLSGILLLIGVMVLVGLIAWVFSTYKPLAPENRKSLVKLLWKILFGILGLFFIIYLVLIIYFKHTGKL